MVRKVPMRTVPAMLATAALIAAGCSGSIGDSTGAGSTPGPNGPNGPNGPSGPGPSGPNGPSSQPVASLHKLTAVEFTNSLHDLLGSNVPVSTKLEPDQQLDGFRSISASLVAVSPMGVSQFETAITAAAQFAFSSATQAAAVLSCVPTSAADAACPI